MTDEVTLAFSISFMANVFFLILILWRRSDIALAVSELIHRQKAKRIRIIYKDGLVKQVTVPNVKDFDWKSGVWDKFFKKDIQKELNNPEVPPRPYLYDMDTGRPEYEFFEESTKCVDPFQRKPNLEQLKNQRRNYVGAYMAAYAKARMGVKDNLSWIIIIGLALVALVGIVNVSMSNSLTEQTETGFQKVDNSFSNLPKQTYELFDQNFFQKAVQQAQTNRLVPLGGSPND